MDKQLYCGLFAPPIQFMSSKSAAKHDDDGCQYVNNLEKNWTNYALFIG